MAPEVRAGLRTNILIAIGATLFTVMSIDLASAMRAGTRPASPPRSSPASAFSAPAPSCAPATGIRGLTTASMIWVNAAIGVAVGGGEYRLALITTGVTLVVLVALNPVERMIDRATGGKNQRDARDS